MCPLSRGCSKHGGTTYNRVNVVVICVWELLGVVLWLRTLCSLSETPFSDVYMGLARVKGICIRFAIFSVFLK